LVAGRRVWILEHHAGVAALKELAQILAGQSDAMAIFLGIQEAKDVLQDIVWERTQDFFARGKLSLLRQRSGRRGFVGMHSTHSMHSFSLRRSKRRLL
jgi:hypothetical protein